MEGVGFTYKQNLLGMTIVVCGMLIISNDMLVCHMKEEQYWVPLPVTLVAISLIMLLNDFPK